MSTQITKGTENSFFKSKKAPAFVLAKQGMTLRQRTMRNERAYWAMSKYA